MKDKLIKYLGGFTYEYVDDLTRQLRSSNRQTDDALNLLEQEREKNRKMGLQLKKLERRLGYQ